MRILPLDPGVSATLVNPGQLEDQLYLLTLDPVPAMTTR